MTLRRTPLFDRHVTLGAKTADFGGWEMPIEYAGAGTVAEHTSVRERVGVFDVSHMGKVRVSGAGAADAVNAVLTNDIGRLAPGQAQYSMLCHEAGGVIDDLIVYLVSGDEVFIVPNAANAGEVVAGLRATLPAELSVDDQHEQWGILAVQGPGSANLLAALGFPVEHEYMSFVDASFADGPVRVCRTGYTGELGYELLVPPETVGQVWDAVVGAGAQPAGLGARDTLRTEMGYPLHGHELSRDISPVQARCGWAVGWSKDAFWGRDALLAEKQAGPRRLLRGLRATGRGVPRADMAVLRDAAPVGITTSGTFSPTLNVGIALALIDTDAGIADGDVVSVDVRGRALDCEVVKPPFVDVKTR
jgi:aminomethyltransferase